MRVKVEDQWYDSNDVPVMLELSKNEQKQIAEINREKVPKGRYTQIPAKSLGWSQDQQRQWMAGGLRYSQELPRVETQTRHLIALAHQANNIMQFAENYPDMDWRQILNSLETIREMINQFGMFPIRVKDEGKQTEQKARTLANAIISKANEAEKLIQ